MKGNALTLLLLDFLAYKTGCAYLSDLPRAGGGRLARVLEGIPAGDADLREWNDALAYLAKAPPEETGPKARARLIQLLSRP